MLGQMHMLQHQVGMATRVELARFKALIDVNAVLGRALAATQKGPARGIAKTASGFGFE